jgi:hypothetical protein
MPKGPVSKIANACAESASAGAENKGEEIGEKMSKLNMDCSSDSNSDSSSDSSSDEDNRNLTPVRNVDGRIPGAPEKRRRIRMRKYKIRNIGNFSDEAGEGC